MPGAGLPAVRRSGCGCTISPVDQEERTLSLTTGEGLTIADLEAMLEDGHRYELLGGSIEGLWPFPRGACCHRPGPEPFWPGVRAEGFAHGRNAVTVRE